MLWDAGSFPPWHGTANSPLSTLETFHLVFFRHSSLLKSAILELLLEAAQRPRISASGAFIPPLLVLPFSAPSLDLAVDFGQGAAGVTQGAQSTWSCRIPVPFSTPCSGCSSSREPGAGLHHKPSSSALEWKIKLQSSHQCSPSCSVFCVSPVGASSGSVWVWHPN